MSFAKFNISQIQRNSNSSNETKFQKYLKERNAKILERCFNIKTEKSVVKTDEPFKELQNLNTNKLPGQPTAKESYQPNDEITQISSLTVESPIDNVCSSKQETNNSNTLDISKSPNQSTITQNHRHVKSATLKPTKVTSNFTNIKSGNTQSARSSTATNWKSSFISSGSRYHLSRRPQTAQFAYDLSRDELKFSGHFRSPMKPLPDAESELLKHGSRREYLNQRYEHSPKSKYNYPEATSWRIGWLQQQ
ncbi:uncharacterized protein ACRADG_010961 [Cochliomyia hominivorax]